MVVNGFNMFDGEAPWITGPDSLIGWANRRQAEAPKIRCTAYKQATTGADVIVSEKAGETIVDIGKTELTVLLTASANDNAYDGQTTTIVYKDSSGVEHTVTGTFDTADSTTGVAMCSDFYDLTSMVSTVAAQGAGTILLATAGVAATYGTIQAAAGAYR